MKATNDTGNSLIYEVGAGARAGTGCVGTYVHTLFVQTSLHYPLYN